MDPVMRALLRITPEGYDQGYDQKHLKHLLIADDFNLEQKPLAILSNYMKRYGVGCRIFLSNSGILGLVPAIAKVGDTLTNLHGAHFASVLRPKEDTHWYIGEACELKHGFLGFR